MTAADHASFERTVLALAPPIRAATLALASSCAAQHSTTTAAASASGSCKAFAKKGDLLVQIMVMLVVMVVIVAMVVMS